MCVVFYNNQELRYYAYLAGNIRPPTSVVMDPFVQTIQEKSRATPLNTPEDQFQSISMQLQYDKHSHEVRFRNFVFAPIVETQLLFQQELRVAFLLYGRETTSAEILQLQNPLANPSSIVPSQPITTIPGRSIPPPVFAASTSMPVPKFTFGLR